MLFHNCTITDSSDGDINFHFHNYTTTASSDGDIISELLSDPGADPSREGSGREQPAKPAGVEPNGTDAQPVFGVGKSNRIEPRSRSSRRGAKNAEEEQVLQLITVLTLKLLPVIDNTTVYRTTTRVVDCSYDNCHMCHHDHCYSFESLLGIVLTLHTSY